jgi:hypothetical protein
MEPSDTEDHTWNYWSHLIDGTIWLTYQHMEPFDTLKAPDETIWLPFKQIELTHFLINGNDNKAF